MTDTFRRISESHKRDESDVTRIGRKKIGRIGIGFIAANEICDEMEILSTKKGSKELLHVTVYFNKMRQDIESRRRGDLEIAKADYEGDVEETNSPSHFTQIFLKKVRGEAKKILAGAQSPRPEARHRSLYGCSVASVRKLLANPRLTSWSEFNKYSQTMLGVALNVPVNYHNDWLPNRGLEQVRAIVEEIKSLHFTLQYDGTELRKPIVLFRRNPNVESPSAYFVRRFNYSGDKVAAHGYFYVQHGTIKPEELQGSLIRIRQAAVGNYDSTFRGFLSQKDR